MTAAIFAIGTLVVALLALFVYLSMRGLTTAGGPATAAAPLEFPASPSKGLKLLVAIDGSPCSPSTIAAVAARPWPRGSEIEVLTVIHSRVPVFPDPALSLAASHEEDVERQEHAAPATLQGAVDRLRFALPGMAVTSKVAEGDPAKVIVAEAGHFQADEVIVGSHGHGAVKRWVLGSVSQSIVLHAPCSVLVVRHPRGADPQARSQRNRGGGGVARFTTGRGQRPDAAVADTDGDASVNPSKESST